ncbi:hypothetical protein [Sphingobium sp.]|uniref:hypothetical protein n=1 Tax=Sphingobium sp. TaxID=1912891 RepID=UPI003BB6244C
MTEPADTALSPHTDRAEDPVAEESVKDVFARLIADGRAYAAAEADKQKLRAAVVAIAIRNVAIFAIIALMVVFAGIIVLLVGMVIALTPHIGALWATLAVFGGSLLAAIILLLLAKASIGRMKKAIAP